MSYCAAAMRRRVCISGFIRGLELNGVCGQILLYHERDLEDDSVVEFTQIETCEFLDLVQSVNECVSVYEQLSRSLGNVEVVLEESLYREQSLVVEGLDRTLLEHFLEEGLTERCGQVIDKSRDAEVVVAYYVLLGVEYLADFDSYLSFLERACEVLHADNGSTDTDVDAGEELGLERVSDRARELFEVLYVYSALYLLYENYLALGDVEDEVLVLVREEVLYNVISRYVVRGYDADEEDNSVDIRVEVQLAGLDAYIARENVIENYVLYEVVAVILLVIILLDA